MDTPVIGKVGSGYQILTSLEMMAEQVWGGGMRMLCMKEEQLLLDEATGIESMEALGGR